MGDRGVVRDAARSGVRDTLPRLATRVLSPYAYCYVSLREECAVVIHEVGHVLGLSHDADTIFPIMGGDLRRAGPWPMPSLGALRGASATGTVRASKRALLLAEATRPRL